MDLQLYGQYNVEDVKHSDEEQQGYQDEAGYLQHYAENWPEVVNEYAYFYDRYDANDARYNIKACEDQARKEGSNS